MLTPDERELFWGIINAAAQAYKSRSRGVLGEAALGYNALIEGLKNIEAEASLSGNVVEALDARSARIALQIMAAERGVNGVTEC